MRFPEIVGKLLHAGFDGYLVDRRRNTTTYYLADGDKSCLKTVRRAGRSRAFNQPAVFAQIRGRKPIRLKAQSWWRSGARAFLKQETRYRHSHWAQKPPPRRDGRAGGSS